MSRHSHLYKTTRWQRIRAQQLSLEPLCRMCAARKRTTLATVCDHVEPHRGDPAKFHAGPFQSLCQSCHSGDKQLFERTGKAPTRIGLDGWPME